MGHEVIGMGKEEKEGIEGTLKKNRYQEGVSLVSKWQIIIK